MWQILGKASHIYCDQGNCPCVSCFLLSLNPGCPEPWLRSWMIYSGGDDITLHKGPLTYQLSTKDADTYPAISVISVHSSTIPRQEIQCTERLSNLFNITQRVRGKLKI